MAVNRILITGAPGSGTSTLGRELAMRLGYRFRGRGRFYGALIGH